MSPTIPPPYPPYAQSSPLSRPVLTLPKIHVERGFGRVVIPFLGCCLLGLSSFSGLLWLLSFSGFLILGGVRIRGLAPPL